MSHTDTTDTRPPVTGPALVVLVLGLALLGVALILGLVLIAGPDGRTDVLSWLSGIVPIIGTVLTGTAVAQVRKVAQTAAKIDKQTNGVLDARIRDGVSAALVDHGIPPARRASDPGEPGDPATPAAP